MNSDAPSLTPVGRKGYPLPMSAITSHVLDTGRGRPAAGVPVTLEKGSPSGWKKLAQAQTDADGRVREFKAKPKTGLHRLVFGTGVYYKKIGVKPFHPIVIVTFTLKAGEHYHIPLLLSPFGYTTYRGS